MKYFIKTFGCQQNIADSERIAATYQDRGFQKAKGYINADVIIINTCMVRESAENRIYGLTNNLKNKPKKVKIILTGCMVGLALKDKTGKYLKKLKNKLPMVDEFMAIEEIGFEYPPLRTDKKTAFIPISNGCNNFCTYCVVPYSRGREISRPFEKIIEECEKLKKDGCEEAMLLGQNVNSYGADLFKIKNTKFPIPNQVKNLNDKKHFEIENLKPVYVKHLGRERLPTLFPHLLNTVAKLGFKKVDFLSSNPWDFSDELIKTIVENKNITRTIHLPVQSGSTKILKAMNRWYTREEYLALISKLKNQISNLKLTTDIIVGFPGETEADFQETVDLCKKVGFTKAYVNRYSPRPFAISTKTMKDNVSPSEKKRRWQILDDLINK